MSLSDFINNIKEKTKEPPRWLLSSKFTVWLATLVGLWLIGLTMPAQIVWGAVVVSSVFIAARAYTEVEQAKVNEKRDARMTDLSEKRLTKVTSLIEEGKIKAEHLSTLAEVFKK